MEFYKKGICRSIYSFLFDAELHEPLLLAKKNLRENYLYNQDADAKKTALEYIRYITKCFGGSAYLFIAGKDILPPNKLRSKKGVLWNYKKLRTLDAYEFEVEAKDNSTRLSAIVDLDKFDYNHSADLVLNWIFCFIVLTDLDIENLHNYAKRWLAIDKKAVLGFHYGLIAKDLTCLSTTAVLRYFPADNERNEMIAILGNEDFIRNRIMECVAPLS